MELEKVLLSRKSCRAYQDKAVEAEKLEKIITSASLAPLGLPKMCTPMLTLVTDKAILAQLNGIYDAPAVIIVSCPPSPAPGIGDQNAACVVEMMSLMATDLGLGNIYLYGVTVGLQKDTELKAKLGIPENFTPLAALAVGYGVEDVAVCKEFAPKLEITRF
ncbi:MAG: nitroreductase family protein [Oscillospiraceae bacterium]|nr:nitroreductase family protein [Oscillospiraceae bacterium]